MEACTMHVEFRIASVDSMISFDAESFIRMHQIKHLPLHGPQRRHSLVKLPHGGVNFTNDFRPRIQLQFVLENHVRIQSSPIKDVVPSAGQGEMEKWRWDASDIRTRRYYSKSSQAIVTSLPRKFVNREVKIRLLQLAPDLDKAERDIVEASFPEYSQLEDTSLCLGVARISLKDLIVTSSGVSVALQPKRGMMKAVEGLNLNTIETNAIFGRDGGGSGVVVFQVVSIVFNPRSFSFLLHSKHPGDGVAPSLLLDNGRTDSTVHTPSPGINGFDGAPSSVAEARRQMNSGVVRFVLVPYMALVDAVLRYNDALSWRNPIKTSVLLCIMWIMISTEMVDLGLVLAVAFEAASVFRTMTFFCRVPPYMNTGCNSVEFSAERVGSFQAVLYGSHNHVINSMVRARLFFTQGLQADCYFELVYLSYRLRKLTRNTLWYIALLVLGSCVVSIETLALLGVLFAFFVHPLLLRASFSRLRKTWRRQLASGTFWKGIALSRPMTVTRVVQVDIPQERSAWPRSLTGLARFPVHHGTDECKTKCELLTFFPHERTGSGVKDNETGSIFCLDSPRQKLAVSSPPAESSTTCIGARNLSLFGGSSAHLPNILSRSFLWKHDAVKHDQQGVQDLTFVVIVITNEHPSSNGAKSVGPPNVGTPLLQRLHRVLQRANSLERPPPVNMLGAHYQTLLQRRFYVASVSGKAVYTRCLHDHAVHCITPSTINSDREVGSASAIP
uniref:Uncharacterized protein n=1 Tax=Trypanosoma congolense (strain IL3000) TaxID=1068625 RepID=G0UVN6_TRYCI|nr:conserved hypothetical protein [Trypanosoma congolense IL3000]